MPAFIDLKISLCFNDIVLKKLNQLARSGQEDIQSGLKIPLDV